VKTGPILGISLLFGLAACAADSGTADGNDGQEEALVASSERPTQRLLGRGDPNRRVLIVLSAANQIDLIPDSEHTRTKFTTGVFPRELSEPLKVLAEKGYTFDFATPGGVSPTWDKNGLELSWFFWGDSERFVGDRILKDALTSGRDRDAAVSLLMEAFGSLTIADKPALSLLELPYALKQWKNWEAAEGLKPIPPKSLADVANAIDRAAESGAPNPYVAIFVPGGHAPMTDLGFDPNMAKVLSRFHEQRKPIGVICHGPVALMSLTGKKDVAGWRAMTDDERAAWPYHGYTMTVESTIEEHIMEKAFVGGQKVAYYVDGELERAGAHLAPANPKFIPGLAKVSADRELVSGQSPASANCLARVLDESIQLSRRSADSTQEWWSARAPVTCDGQPD